MHTPPSLIVSAHDARRLEGMLDSIGPESAGVARALEVELARAEIRESSDVPEDVVTMNSKVLCVDEIRGTEHVVRLVYPWDASGSEVDVSVLAPVGAALLGLRAGQSIEWPLPGGRTTRLRVSGVLYQPSDSSVDRGL